MSIFVLKYIRKKRHSKFYKMLTIVKIVLIGVAAVKQAKVGLAKGGSQAGQRWHLHKRSNTG